MCSDKGWFEIGEEQEPRYYRVNGRRYPSVTSVTGIVGNEYLQQWRGRVGNETADTITNEAAQFGSLIHEYAALMDLMPNEDIGSPTYLLPLLQQYTEWRNSNVQHVVSVEMQVYSSVYEYAGTLDRVMVLHGEEGHSVWDIKTGTVKPITGLQLAAYAIAYQEMTGIRCKKGGVIALSRRTGKMKVLPDVMKREDKQHFLNLLALWKRLH